MAAESELTASSYIQHHLSFLTKSVGEGSFWTLHVDTLFTSVLVGMVALGFLWWVARGATAGVPTRRQAFVELAIEFIDEQVKGIFNHPDRDRLVAPLALTVFVWVLVMNAMDFIPADLAATALGAVGLHQWRLVPTADVNMTFALALSVWLLMIGFAIAAKGLGGWLHELVCSPFGMTKASANPLKWLAGLLLAAANLLFNLIEYISKPLSHSLRLFGNMYAGEIIFLLLWMWASTGLVGTLFGSVLGVGWAIFHILIVVLQAYIFMMLTVVYLSLAREHH